MATYAEIYSGMRLIDTDVRTDKSSERAIILIASVFSHSKEPIKIVGGQLNSKFYDDERITKAFKKAYNNGAKIEIICGPEIDPNTKSITKLRDENILEVWQGKICPRVHFWIVDGRDVGLEDPHTIGFQKKTHTTILSDARPQANALLKKFEEMKRNLL